MLQRLPVALTFAIAACGSGDSGGRSPSPICTEVLRFVFRGSPAASGLYWYSPPADGTWHGSPNTGPLYIENAGASAIVVESILNPSDKEHGGPCRSLSVGPVGPGERRRAVLDEPLPSWCWICARAPEFDPNQRGICFDLQVLNPATAPYCE